jgi:SAM-dependent methyltransferase
VKDESVACTNAAQQRTFDELCFRFLESLAEDVLERMGEIVDAARIAMGEPVLDVGTGTGALIPLIRSHHPGRVVACDLSGKMLEENARRHPDVELHRCDVRDLALGADSVDVVFMNAVFGNIADKDGALRNITRMLRPGGRVVISHPEGRAFVERIAQTDPFPITPLPTREELGSFLAGFGLDMVHYVDEERLFVAVAVKD